MLRWEHVILFISSVLPQRKHWTTSRTVWRLVFAYQIYHRVPELLQNKLLASLSVSVTYRRWVCDCQCQSAARRETHSSPALSTHRLHQLTFTHGLLSAHASHKVKHDNDINATIYSMQKTVSGARQGQVCAVLHCSSFDPKSHAKEARNLHHQLHSWHSICRPIDLGCRRVSHCQSLECTCKTWAWDTNDYYTVP